MDNDLYLQLNETFVEIRQTEHMKINVTELHSGTLFFTRCHCGMIREWNQRTNINQIQFYRHTL